MQEEKPGNVVFVGNSYKIFRDQPLKQRMKKALLDQDPTLLKR